MRGVYANDFVPVPRPWRVHFEEYAGHERAIVVAPLGALEYVVDMHCGVACLPYSVQVGVIEPSLASRIQHTVQVAYDNLVREEFDYGEAGA